MNYMISMWKNTPQSKNRMCKNMLIKFTGIISVISHIHMRVTSITMELRKSM